MVGKTFKEIADVTLGNFSDFEAGTQKLKARRVSCAFLPHFSER